MRISSNTIFRQGVTGMLDRQQLVTKTQRQVATGQRMVTASDDPVAWASAVVIDRSRSELEQLGRNSVLIKNRLEHAESTLGSVGDAVTRVRELLVQAANASNGNDERQAIALEIRQHLDEIVGLANMSDGNGRYLFGGAQNSSAPFQVSSGSATAYAGDAVQRRLDISFSSAVADVDPGSEVFLRIRKGDGYVEATPDSGNTGTGTLKNTVLFDTGSWDEGSYRIVFTDGATADDPDTYQVLDATSAVVATGDYTAGEYIEFQGVRVSLEGNPSTGDTFTIAKAGVQDIFTTLDSIASALEQNIVTDTEYAEFRNSMYSALVNIDAAQDHLIDKRAGFGARLHTIDLAAEEREDTSISLQLTLSELRDVDYAEAISRLTLEMTALQAAQESFVRMQSLSLFNYLN